MLRSPGTVAFLFELTLLPAGGKAICICMWHAMWRLAGTKHRCCVMASLAVLVLPRRLMLHAAREWLSVDCMHGPVRRVVVHDSNEIIHFGRCLCLRVHLHRVLLGTLRPWNRLEHVSVTDIDSAHVHGYPMAMQAHCSSRFEATRTCSVLQMAHTVDNTIANNDKAR